MNFCKPLTMKKQTRSMKIFTLTFAALVSANCLAEVNDTIERQFEFDNTGRIQLSNVNGDVTISACDCSQVSLTARIIASSQEMRDRISIEIEESHSNLRVKTRYEDNHGSSWRNEHSEVIYNLTVPNNVRLDNIDLVNGNLEIRGVTGALDADLVNGDIKSDGRTTSTRVEMVNGDMDIRFTELTQSSEVSLNSVNGDINVYLPAESNARIEAETVSGRISNDFGIEVIKHRYVGSEMRGTIGSGDVRIDLENVNGRIKVKSL